MSNSIGLAGRLWLVIDIQDLKPGVYQTLRTAWPWLESLSLVDVLQSMRGRVHPREAEGVRAIWQELLRYEGSD